MARCGASASSWSSALLGVFALFAVFAPVAFPGGDRRYNAEFTNVTGLENGDFVRIAGVEVGKVKNISIQPDTTGAGRVHRRSTRWCSPRAARAVIRYDDLIGGRYLALQEGAGGSHEAQAGRTRSRWTAPSRRWTWTR